MSILLYILDLAFLASLIIVPAAWLMTPINLWFGSLNIFLPWSARLLAIPVLLLTARVVLRKSFSGRGLWELRLFKNLSMALASTFIFFLAVEQILEWFHYEAHLPPVIIVGKELKDSSGKDLYVNDSRLLFRFRPGAELNGRVVNSMGFLDREINPVKKTGAVRVICMGDSVTGQGIPPYSGHLNSKLIGAPPSGSAWESFNMAVHGYTSVQGLRLFELQARALNPDFVIIMYGWNDHWLSPLPDSNRMAREMSPGRATLYRILRMKRFGQLLLSLSGQRNLVQKENESGVRVPPEEYMQTLMRFVAEVRDAGAIPILMTSPRAATISRALVHRRQTPSVEEAIRAHDEYNDIVRKVAEDTHTPLIDLARKLSGDEYAGLFSDDGIHFNSPAGIVLIADEVYRKIGELAKATP
jgi:lysophospholipase L1-like esterase